jgi:hypothetical protein
VLIRNCLFGSNFAAVGIGSEMSGGVRDIYVENCKVTHAINALYLKSRIGRGGYIENICAENLDGSVKVFLRIDLMNRGINDDPVPGLAGITQASNIYLGDSAVDCGTLADASVIANEKPLVGLSIVNISGTCKKGILLSNIVDANLRGIEVTGYDGPLLSIHNVTGTGLEGGVAFTPNTRPSTRLSSRRQRATTED